MPYDTTVMRSKLSADDLSKAFDEFWEDTDTQRCMRARCRYCGFARAKNSTRQNDHLATCQPFINSAEGRQALSNGTLHMAPADPDAQDIWKGGAPNPNLNLQRGKSRPRPSLPGPERPPPAKASIVQHLLTKHRAAVEDASQQAFLSHAGCGTLSQAALQQWLHQQGHVARAFATFIGGLIGKMRLPETRDPQVDTAYRTFDLLASTLNNAKRELDFLRTTQAKYDLVSEGEPAKYASKGLADLFASAMAPSASLLEGLVLLWSLEHLHLVSWQYAAGFYQPSAPSSTSYSLPSYLQTVQYDGFGGPSQGGSDGSNPGHVKALHEALIPNWTSVGFGRFVEACCAIVDELANAQTKGSGAAELTACEATFRQVVWLWRQMWPEVTGMGEQTDETTTMRAPNVAGPSRANGAVGRDHRAHEPIEIPDDDADVDVDVDALGDVGAPGSSSFDGNGLDAVAAASRGD